MSCFRYALALEDREPAEPGVFNTAIPNWRLGDECLVGAELQRFRIRGMAGQHGSI